MSHLNYSSKKGGPGTITISSVITRSQISNIKAHAKVTGQINRRESGKRGNNFTWNIHMDAMEKMRKQDPIGWIKWKYAIIRKKKITAELLAHHN